MYSEFSAICVLPYGNGSFIFVNAYFKIFIVWIKNIFNTNYILSDHGS